MNRITGLIAVLVAFAACEGVAAAHQTTTSNGARVTMHVAPNDEPASGRPATVAVTRVAVPRRARFSFASCGCRLRVTDSSGNVVTSRRMRKRTRVTFPRAGAYRLVYSGAYRDAGKPKRFAASFAIRAS